MKKSGASQDQPASELIARRIAELADWRGETLGRMRELIRKADPDVAEEWKWMNPVWSNDGIICTGESYKKVVKLTFAKGAFLKDPAGLFNSSLDGNVRRAIDIHEREEVDESAFKALVRQAVALNSSATSKPPKKAKSWGKSRRLNVSGRTARGCAMDTCRVSVDAFDRLAETYAAKFLALDLYDAYYRQFCVRVARQGTSILDVACGPGNVSAFLVRERPDLQVLGIDLAPNMVRLARANVPSASFLVHDCRRLADLGRVFDGIVYAFGLNYLNQEEAERFFESLRSVLAPTGALYLSTMLGSSEQSGLQTASSGDQVYVYYRPRVEIERLVRNAGMEIVLSDELASPPGASMPTTDVVLIAQRTGVEPMR